MMPRKTRLLIGTLVAAGLLAGCDKLKRERYEMIQVHQDAHGDVERLIGPPDYTLPGQWHYEREDKHLIVRVDFNEAGVVTRKQWIDAMQATWEDSAANRPQPVYESTTIETRHTDTDD